MAKIANGIKQDQMSIDAVEGKTHRTQMTDNMIFHVFMHLNIQMIDHIY